LYLKNKKNIENKLQSTARYGSNTSNIKNYPSTGDSTGKSERNESSGIDK